MPTDLYNAIVPSGSSNGRQKKISGTTSGAADTLHTTGAGIDEIYVYAINTSGADVYLTIVLGGTTSPDDEVTDLINSKAGYQLIIPGVRLNGTVAIKAFAASADVINCLTIVNKLS